MWLRGRFPDGVKLSSALLGRKYAQATRNDRTRNPRTLLIRRDPYGSDETGVGRSRACCGAVTAARAQSALPGLSRTCILPARLLCRRRAKRDRFLRESVRTARFMAGSPAELGLLAANCPYLHTYKQQEGNKNVIKVRMKSRIDHPATLGIANRPIPHTWLHQIGKKCNERLG